MGFLKQAWGLTKKLFTFDIRKHAPEGSKVLSGTVPIAGTGAGAIKGALRTKTVLGKIAKSFIPVTTKGKIYAGVGTAVGAGILKTSPTARTFAKEKVLGLPQVPKKIFGFGGEVGKVIEKERTFGKEDIVKGLKVAGILGAGVAVGAVVIPKVIEKVKEIRETKQEKELQPVESVSVDPAKQLLQEKPIGIQGEVPITPETTTIPTGKKTYKPRRAPKQPSVKQSVRLNIINTSTGIKQTNKYLSQKVLA